MTSVDAVARAEVTGVGAPPAELVAFCVAQRPRVVGALALFLGDDRLAEELAHDVFVVVCRDWEKVRVLDHPGPWVHRVAMNRARSWFRRRSAERRAVSRSTAGAPMPAAVEDATLMRSLVAALPEHERAVIVLRFYADLSVAETARALRIAEGTVKSRTSRAIDAMRKAGFDEEATDEH